MDGRSHSFTRHTMCAVYPSFTDAGASNPNLTSNPTGDGWASNPNLTSNPTGDGWAAPALSDSTSPPLLHSGDSAPASAAVLSAIADRFASPDSTCDGAYLHLPASSIRSQLLIFGGMESGINNNHPQFFGDVKILLAIGAPGRPRDESDEAEPVLVWVVAPIHVARASFVPAPRIHHSACIVDLPESRGGPRHIVFGGLSEHIMGDVHSLRLGNFARYTLGKIDSTGSISNRMFSSSSIKNSHSTGLGLGLGLNSHSTGPSIGDVAAQWSLEWEEVVVQAGPQPGGRYAHSMTTCATTDGEELMVLVGGTDERSQVPLSDVWILHIVDSRRSQSLARPSSHSLMVRWERVGTELRAPLVKAPPGRMMHQALSVRPGHVLVFGGCHGSLRESHPEQSSVLELHLRRLDDSATACSWGYLANDRVPGGGCPSQVCLDRQIEVQSEPTTTLMTDCLHADLLQLFRSGLRADLVFDLGPGYAGDGSSAEPIVAHEVLVSRRCDVLRTMIEWQRERRDESSSGNGVQVLSVLDDEAAFRDPPGEGADEDHEAGRRERHCARRRVFRAMLEYLYTDTLLCSTGDVTALLALANRYQLSRLSQLCEGFLARQVTVDSAGPLLQYADWFSLETLKVCQAHVNFNVLLKCRIYQYDTCNLPE